MALGSVQSEGLSCRGGVSDSAPLAGDGVPGLFRPDAHPLGEDMRVLPGETEQARGKGSNTAPLSTRARSRWAVFPPLSL